MICSPLDVQAGGGIGAFSIASENARGIQDGLRQPEQTMFPVCQMSARVKRLVGCEVEIVFIVDLSLIRAHSIPQHSTISWLSQLTS